jgi:hypothetical protein
MKCPGFSGDCLGNVSHSKCNHAQVRFDKHASGWGLLRHSGDHLHPWPEAKKPDPLSQLEFAREIQKNPQAGAFKLKVHMAFFFFFHRLISIDVVVAATERGRPQCTISVSCHHPPGIWTQRPVRLHYTHSHHHLLHSCHPSIPHRRKMLVALGLKPDELGGGIGDKFILDMFAWAA